MKKTYEERLREYYLKVRLTNKEILERAGIINDPKEKAEFIRGQKAKRDKIKNEGFPKAIISDLQPDGTFKEIENKNVSSFDIINDLTPLADLFKNPAFESMKKTQKLISDIAESTEENSDLALDNASYREDDKAYLENLFTEAESKGSKREMIDFLIQSKYRIVNKYESNYRPELTDDQDYKTIKDRINEKIEELKNPVNSQARESKIKINIQPFQFVEIVRSLELLGIVDGLQKDIVQEFADFFQIQMTDTNYRSAQNEMLKRKPIKVNFLPKLQQALINEMITKAEKKDKK